MALIYWLVQNLNSKIHRNILSQWVHFETTSGFYRQTWKNQSLSFKFTMILSVISVSPIRLKDEKYCKILYFHGWLNFIVFIVLICPQILFDEQEKLNCIENIKQHSSPHAYSIFFFNTPKIHQTKTGDSKIMSWLFPFFTSNLLLLFSGDYRKWLYHVYKSFKINAIHIDMYFSHKNTSINKTKAER